MFTSKEHRAIFCPSDIWPWLLHWDSVIVFCFDSFFYRSMFVSYLSALLFPLHFLHYLPFKAIDSLRIVQVERRLYCNHGCTLKLGIISISFGNVLGAHNFLTLVDCTDCRCWSESFGKNFRHAIWLIPPPNDSSFLNTERQSQ